MKATSEQRAAWESLKTPHTTSTYDLQEALGTLAAAWIAEHPDDEDEVATWEWLLTAGWWESGPHKLYTDAPTELAAWRDSDIRMSVGVYCDGVRRPLIENPTRRQVRLLVEALGDGLGIKLKEAVPHA